MTNMPINAKPRYAFDAELYLHDGGLKTASFAGLVSAAAKILDVGDARFEGYWVVNVTALEHDTDDEVCQVFLQGSLQSDFSADVVNLALCELSAPGALLAGADTERDVGGVNLPCSNVLEGVAYPYLRIYCVIGGTVATGFNFTSWLSRRAG